MPNAFQKGAETTGALKDTSEPDPITKLLTPLSESLGDSLDTLPDDALSILGPELFDQANKELSQRPQSREANNRSGTLVNATDGYMRFFYRDEKSRARHMDQNIVGLVYPCSKTDAEKRHLPWGLLDTVCFGHPAVSRIPNGIPFLRVLSFNLFDHRLRH